MDEQLVIRFLSHQCSPEEVEQVERWIRADKTNAERFFETERLWSLKDEARFSDRKEIMSAYERFLSTRKGKYVNFPGKIRRPLLQWTGYVAAIILLGILSIHLYIEREEDVIVMNVIEVPEGQHTSLTLSDGTKVELNSGSTLTYPSNFSSKNRVVNLTGEAYFNVTHREGSPFIVAMPLLEVKVLGTKFNVKAYKDEDTEVTLESGRVEVFLDKDAGDKDASGLKLYPNQQLVCNSIKTVSLREVDASAATCWLVGGFFFDNQPLASIIKDLERKFCISIQIQGKDLAKEVFTCHTKAGATLEQILEVLKNTRKLTYSQNEKTIIVSTPQ